MRPPHKIIRRWKLGAICKGERKVEVVTAPQSRDAIDVFECLNPGFKVVEVRDVTDDTTV